MAVDSSIQAISLLFRIHPLADQAIAFYSDVFLEPKPSDWTVTKSKVRKILDNTVPKTY